jgi:leucyl-tRNA synthetase
MIIDQDADEVVLNAALTESACDDDQNRMLHQTIKKVTEDTDSMSFNTAIARMMEFTNFFTRCDSRPIEAMNTFLILLSPYAPHIAEELWSKLGNEDSIAHATWPTWNESALVESSVEVPIQINGKVKTKISVAPDASKQVIEETALADDKVKELLDGKTIVKQIVVPGRLVNFVVK